MKNRATSLILLSMLLAGCGHVYFVRKASVEGIYAQIARSPETHVVKRVVITGWVLDGFEISRIHSTQTREGPSIDIQGGLPWEDGNPFRHTYPYTYRLAKIRIEGTLLYFPSPRTRPVLVDNIVKVLSPIEEMQLDQKEKNEPNNAMEPIPVNVTPAVGF